MEIASSHNRYQQLLNALTSWLVVTEGGYNGTRVCSGKDCVGNSQLSIDRIEYLYMTDCIIEVPAPPKESKPFLVLTYLLQCSSAPEALGSLVVGESVVLNSQRNYREPPSPRSRGGREEYLFSAEVFCQDANVGDKIPDLDVNNQKERSKTTVHADGCREERGRERATSSHAKAR